MLGVGIAVAIAACAQATNLLDPTTPAFSAEYAPRIPDTSTTSSIRIVAFNIKLSRRIDRAIKVLRSDSLRDADILALEEMDDSGVDRIARALRLNYVYYPGSIHPTDHRYFGPAVLSRWPIERSWKLFLPHKAGSDTSSARPPSPSFGCAAGGYGYMPCTWRRRSGSRMPRAGTR